MSLEIALCGNCAYYAGPTHAAAEIQPGLTATGECRRHAPTGHVDHRWPSVIWNRDWCGDHESTGAL